MKIGFIANISFGDSGPAGSPGSVSQLVFCNHSALLPQFGEILHTWHLDCILYLRQSPPPPREPSNVFCKRSLHKCYNQRLGLNETEHSFVSRVIDNLILGQFCLLRKWTGPPLVHTGLPHDLFSLQTDVKPTVLCHVPVTRSDEKATFPLRWSSPQPVTPIQP